MNWDEDIDFMAGRNVKPKQGRRAGSSSSPDKTEQLLDSALENIGDSPPEALLRSRKTGKWADEGGKSAKSRNATTLIEQERFLTEKIDSDNDDIPIIPDIEEFQDDTTSSDDVEATKFSAMKSTYKELDSELVKLDNIENFSSLTDLNLSALTNFLIPEKELTEQEEEEWSTEMLLQHVATRFKKPEKSLLK